MQLCFKETKCKNCWTCHCADKCEAASSEFSRHKCDRGTLVNLSHKHFHQLVPIPTHPLVEPAWLWGLWVKRTGSSSTSMDSMDTHQHCNWSSERAAALPAHLRCDLFVRSSSTNQGSAGARTHFGERKSCIGQVYNLKDDALALDRSRHWDPVIFMQDGEEILTELSTSLNFKTNICCDLHSGFDIEVMKVFN